MFTLFILLIFIPFFNQITASDADYCDKDTAIDGRCKSESVNAYKSECFRAGVYEHIPINRYTDKVIFLDAEISIPSPNTILSGQK